MNILSLLERHYHKTLPQFEIELLANTNKEFVRAWLIHSIRSDVNKFELFKVLDFAFHWELKEIDYIKYFLKNLQEKQLLPHELDLNIKKDFYEIIAHYFFYKPKKHSKSPNKLGMINSFLPNEALSEMMILSKPYIFDASVIGDKTTKVNHQIRNNSHFPIPIPNNSIILALTERHLAFLSAVNIAHFEPPVILKYEKGQYYKWHYDAILPSTDKLTKEIQSFGQREKSIILYLNDKFQGGETEFKSPFLSLKPKMGHYIMFDNLDENNKPSSIHRGAEVLYGEKWVMTIWTRTKALWLRNGLLS